MSWFRLLRPADEMKPPDEPLTLVFGNFSWILVLFLFGLPVGCAVLGGLYWGLGSAWFNTYYYPILGYYVLVSICQSDYFKSPSRPNWIGLICYAISVSVGIGLFYLHEIILKQIFQLKPDYIVNGHFTYIMFGFLLMGFDETFYLGAIGHFFFKDWDCLKALLFYALTWLVWLAIFLTPLTANAWEFGGRGLDDTALEWMLASMEWVIMGELFCGLFMEEFLSTIRWKSKFRRGNATFLGSIIFGFSIAAVLFTLNSYIWPRESHASIWEHVLYQGTAALNPIILIGLYTNRLEGRYNTPGETCFKLSMLVLLGVVVDYFFYHCIIAPTQLLGNLPWMHHQDLIWNFTVSILCLQHSWFCGRILFLRPANSDNKSDVEEIAADTPLTPLKSSFDNDITIC